MGLDGQLIVTQKRSNSAVGVAAGTAATPAGNGNVSFDDMESSKQVKQVTPPEEQQEHQQLLKEQQQQEQKVSPLVSRIVASIMIPLTLFIAITASVRYSVQEEFPYEYTQIMENWKREPILQLKPNLVSCREYLTLYAFPGTVTGCSCVSSTSSDYVAKGVFVGECNETYLKAKCVTVPSTPTKTFTTWRTGSSDFQLCVERLSGFNYLNSDCSKLGYKQCNVASAGGSSADSNMICVPNDITCPIVDVVLAAIAPDVTYTSIFDTGAGKVYTSRVHTSSAPLSFATISSGIRVCNRFESLHYIDDSIQQYALLRNSDAKCEDQYTDSRFNPILTITEQSLLTANNYLSPIALLPAYPIAQNQVFTLQTRAYVQWKQTGECRSVHMGNFVGLANDWSNLRAIWTALIVIDWMSFVFLGCVVSVLRLTKDWRVKNLFILPAVILLLAQLILTIVNFMQSLSYNSAIHGVASAKCSDDRTNALTFAMNDDFYAGVFVYQIVLISAVVFLALFIAFFAKTVFALKLPARKPKPAKKEPSERGHEEEEKNLFKRDDQDQYNRGDQQQQQGGDKNGKNVTAADAAAAYAKQNQIDADDEEARRRAAGKAANANNKNQRAGNNNNNNNRNQGNQNSMNSLTSAQQNTNYETRQKYTPNGHSANRNGGANGNGNGDVNFNGRGNNNNNGQGNNNGNGQRYVLPGDGKNNNRNSIEMQVIQENPGFQYEMAFNDQNRNNGVNGNNGNQYTGSRVAFMENGGNAGSMQFDEAGAQLVDNNDWEFDIEDYVKKHREKQFSSSRIGGGYEIGKPREKYLQHKFQASHVNRANPGVGIGGSKASLTNLDQLDVTSTEHANPPPRSSLLGTQQGLVLNVNSNNNNNNNQADSQSIKSLDENHALQLNGKDRK